MIICCEICKTSFYICIEVNDKHRDCPPNVMMQNTEYFGLYRNSNIRCDVTPTSRIYLQCSRIFIIFHSPTGEWKVRCYSPRQFNHSPRKKMSWNMLCIAGVKLSARPLALATISLVWAHEIIKAFAHLATVNFNIIVM